MKERIKPVTCVALFGNCSQEAYVERIVKFADQLKQSGLTVCVQHRFHDYLASRSGSVVPRVRVVDDLPAEAEVVISIGGDGTFLRAARWVRSAGVPILGVNTGHLGFLANYSIDETAELVELLCSGGAFIERRSLLHISCSSLPADLYPYALNEVAILKEETSSMLSVNVSVDDDFLGEYLSDGILVSTPTGSTAYNLSAGGPLLQPWLRCMVITPVAPHQLTLRPIVLRSDSKIRAVVSSRAAEFRLSIDGISFPVPCGEEILVERAPFETLTLRRPDDDFYNTLRNELLWGRR